MRVLRFWRDLEIFNIPAAPSARDANDQTKIATLRRRHARNDTLPWLAKQFAPTEIFAYVHVVYVGVADTEDLSRLMLEGLFPELELSERECQRMRGSGWLAAFVVDELGSAKFDSYLPASFAHGVAAMREAKSPENINARLGRAKAEFAQRRHRMSPQLEQSTDLADEDNRESSAFPLSWDNLDEELDVVRRLFGEAASAPRLDWRVVVRTSRVKRRFLEDSLEAATDFLNSFYLDDLDRLIAQAERKQPFGKALHDYLGAALKEQQRVDILTDHAAITRLLDARKLPSARWPASPAQPLVMAQQAAVSHVIGALRDADGLIGINGPPGTGKTTLLCDVIAEIITDRGRRIAALNHPVDIFQDKVVVAGKNFFPLKEEVVAGSGIVVTSTNNNAVKNISQELPAQKKIADQFGFPDYFADVMHEIFRTQKVLGDDGKPLETWGMVAAALGNGGNRRTFAHGFFHDEFGPTRLAEAVLVQGDRQNFAPDREDLDAEHASAKGSRSPSMKQVLETATQEYAQHQDEWRKAKRDFLKLHMEFERYRDILALAGQAALALDESQALSDSLASEEQRLCQSIHASQLALAQLQATLQHRSLLVEGRRTVLEQKRAEKLPSLWDRLMRLLGRETQRMAAIRRTMEAPTQALADAITAFSAMSTEVASVETELRRQHKCLKAVTSKRETLEGERESHRNVLQAGYDTGARHFPDAHFWTMPADVRHRSSIAVGPRLDELRAKLFLQAMNLHRLTVLANAGKFIANLRAVSAMLTGSSRDKLLPEHCPLLWDALFFVVPVVSTTLASFDRLFAGMGQDSLGWLLIDEAGQATPQSAAGAIWRSRRAIVVGDPLQIEPVFTIPRTVAEDLRIRHAVAGHWSPVDESVQSLADRITPFGSWVNKTRTTSPDHTPERLWTGMPLRTHRRCDDPMFTVANKIAYAGQMVQGRVDKAGGPAPWEFSCALGVSTWFNVRSTRVHHPVAEDELACLIDCLTRLQNHQDRAKIYVISPFRKVAQACRKRIGDASLGNIECGTVHTFQGKEAHIVFLVLGTDPGQAGAGARSWASSKPNLLNVAITRAQCRLYVIGDASQWGKVEFFGELLEALAIENVSMSSFDGEREKAGNGLKNAKALIRHP
jgi:hypothetical protein